MIMLTFKSSEARFIKLGNELEKAEEDLVNLHIALQPKYPNSTFVRDCVTLKPPPNVASGKDEHKVSKIFK